MYSCRVSSFVVLCVLFWQIHVWRYWHCPEMFIYILVITYMSCSIVYSFVCSFGRSVVRSFVHSFIHSFFIYFLFIFFKFGSISLVNYSFLFYSIFLFYFLYLFRSIYLFNYSFLFYSIFYVSIYFCCCWWWIWNIVRSRLN